MHIIGDILPDYLLHASWDIHDINKALNVSKTWNMLVKPAKKDPTCYILLRKDCEKNIIVDQECLNAIVLAIQKNDIGIPDAINTIDNGRLFNTIEKYDQGMCFVTIRYLNDFAEMCDSEPSKLVVMYLLYIFMHHYLMIRKTYRELKNALLKTGYKIIQDMKNIMDEHAAIMVPNMEKALRSIKYRRYLDT